MFVQSPEFIYIALVLPSLFALTLIAEGVHKILKNESGWLAVFLGCFFLAVLIFGYFLLIFKR
ncbi:hypothetical protein A2773_06035 [Candidatus Gottesmanbacteria bacterium RIFCSPHIGHO2_01_FULL_39_10]|uniref:Uncharacterized protein n=1 Tax=Candidatus Gottesmanbacteria bacterium RIFCSPHIGHO2_01_FULL_39_10 TaxID=1798375 RepID=A0A1F5ZM21_9BACT|nr:MAG: hypothetical protein A2773_06035 [Candidatus Gottesmanbacteria bacterium RIFCSPHIGHO2_01_FULL_39_10]